KVAENYIQNSSHDPLRPGALERGQATASTMVNAFYMCSYVTPMLAGIVSDVYLGRFKTVLLSYSIYILGITILFITSLPTMLERGAGLPGLIIAMLIISFGVGAMKSLIPPYVAEQCALVTEEVRTKKNGERVFVSREATIEYAINIYYWSCNLGTQSRIAATFIEKDHGFWATYLMALCSLSLGLVLLLLCRKHLIEFKPQDNMLIWAGKAFSIAIRNGFTLDAATVDAVLSRNGKTVSWTNDFIEQLKAGLAASRVFLPFIIYWLCQAQMTTNTVSQAGNMKTHGAPNDLLPALNSFTIVLALPLVNYLVYPRLRRVGFALSPICRIALGFALESLGMAWAAGVQGWIYASPPCFGRPRACAASHGGALPNNLSVAVQLPVYVLEGLGEVFAVPAAYEYAFSRAPSGMRSMIQAVYVLCAAMGSLIALALNPTYKDPDLLFMYAGLAAAMMAVMMLFVVVFYKQNRRDEEKKGRLSRLGGGIYN
ncbi:oligopeptide transporter, partial [Glonium stellatum]